MRPYWIFGQILFILWITVFEFHEVEAKHKVMSLGNWFGSSEKVNIQNIEGVEYTPATEIPEPVVAKRKKSKLKKRKKFLKKDIDWVPEEDSIESLRRTKKKRKRKPVKRNYAKFTRDINITSESEEYEKRRKPVDIIVHIKMND